MLHDLDVPVQGLLHACSDMLQALRWLEEAGPDKHRMYFEPEPEEGDQQGSSLSLTGHYQTPEAPESPAKLSLTRPRCGKPLSAPAVSSRMTPGSRCLGERILALAFVLVRFSLEPLPLPSALTVHTY